ncbi:MAG TPA: peptidylprolyl isomerase [Candidatus Angelobacter sp.]|nr:peptidylprolyl isomerase [Candidatus Angelobacter sp.]
MRRISHIFLFVALISWPALGQTAARAAQTPPAVVHPTPAPVAPDAVVIAIHGFCPGGNQTKPDSCTTTITKEQFDRMVSAMSVNPQALSNPVAMRSFAESYVQALALADAAEKEGADKDPQFVELMRIIRVRTLAEAYRKQLQQKYGNPSDAEVEAYYKQNTGKFEQAELDRIAIPRTNPKLPRNAQADFDRKAQKLAGEIRDRAAKGEDPGKLQVEAYKTLGLTPPMTTDLGTKRRGSLPPALDQEIFSLQAGEVSQLQTEAAVISIYKVRSRTTLPLERVKPELVQEIKQKNLDAAIKQATGQLHTDYNQQFFAPGPAPHGVFPARRP